MAKNTVLNNLTEEETLWADTKRWLGMPLTFTKYRVDHNRKKNKKGREKASHHRPVKAKMKARQVSMGTPTPFMTRKISSGMVLPPRYPRP